MDSKKIEELLNKYWNCETTLEEEEQLKVYFKSDSIPGELMEASRLFQYFSEQKKMSLPDSAIEINSSQRTTSGRGVTRKLITNSMRIAAGFAVVVLSVWFVHRELSEDTSATVEYTDTYDNPQRAFEETKKALQMISKSFTTAEEQTMKINLFNEAQEKIQGDSEEDEILRDS